MTGILFKSFVQGGFESSSHYHLERQRIDVITAARHDEFAATDYSMLAEAGIRTIRDALRWHLIERVPGRYEWSSFLPVLRAARQANVEIIWDLCHYGVPDWLDIWSAGFADCFAHFATAVARLIREETESVPFFTVMNEISFWAWAGGERNGFAPHGTGRGDELKQQLARAAIAATRAVRSILPHARFVQPEPVIHVVADRDRPEDRETAERYRLSQFEAFDMLAGRLQPDLGGSEDLLDIVGANFYWNNQWVHNGTTIGFGHPQYRPLRKILQDLHLRYGRPILVSETGAEGKGATAWFGHVAGEVRNALLQEIPIVGVCLYPIMDYPGWDDHRHCPCGLIEVAEDWRRRAIREDMLGCLRHEAELCEEVLANRRLQNGARV